MNISRLLTANRLKVSSLGVHKHAFSNPLRQNFTPLTLYSRPQYNFGYLQLIRPGFILGKLQKVFASRAGLYRFLVVCAGIHIVATFSGSMMEREVMMNVSDYYTNMGVKDNELFKMYGVLQKGSLQMKRGSLDAKFILTDFKNQVEVVYNGVNKFEFKEGETIVITGYTPDVKKKNHIICVDYMTKHGMEVDSWKDGSGYSRENYGLMKAQPNGMANFTRVA